MRRNRDYFIVSSLILSLGFSVLIAAITIWDFENSFDSFWPKHKKIFRVVKDFSSENGVTHSTSVPYQFSSYLRENIPVEACTNIYLIKFGEQIDVKSEDPAKAKKILQEEGIYFAESDLFKLFPVRATHGSIEKSLSLPNKCVMSSTLAKKIFSDIANGDVIGKSIFIGSIELTIESVFDDVPLNTNFPFKLIISYPTLKQYSREIDSWTTIENYNKCLVMVSENASQTTETEMSRYFSRLDNIVNGKQSYRLQPLSDIHLSTTYDRIEDFFIDRNKVNIIFGCGIVIFIVTALNFLNISFLRNVENAKSMATRMILGAKQTGLLWKNIRLSIFILATAYVVGTLGAKSILQLVSSSLGTDAIESQALSAGTIVLVIGIVMISVLFINTPDYFFIKKLKPNVALKGSLEVSFSKRLVYQKAVLSTLQIVIFQILLVSLLIVNSQVKFLSQKDLGFDKDGMVLIGLSKNNIELLNRFKIAVSESPLIAGVTFSLTAPVGPSNFYWDFRLQEAAVKRSLIGNFKPVDRDFLDIYKIKLIAGRNFKENEKKATIITRNVLLLLHVDDPAKAVGMVIISGTDKYDIVGVVEDFHSSPLRAGLEYIFLIQDPTYYYEAGIRLAPPYDFKNGLELISKKWASIFPDNIFGYTLFTDRLKAYYRFDENINLLLKVFCILGGLVNCFAVMGIIRIYLRSKTKEIVVRKILGANFRDLSMVLLRPALILFIASSILAILISYPLMRSWLDGFAYRIVMSPVYFAGAAVCTLAMITAVIGLPIWRANRINPALLIRKD